MEPNGTKGPSLASEGDTGGHHDITHNNTQQQKNNTQQYDGGGISSTGKIVSQHDGLADQKKYV